MELFPDLTSLEGIVSIIVFAVATGILSSKISNRYLNDSDSKTKRFFVMFSAGIGIGALISSYGVIIAILDLVAMSSYWNILTTFMALFSISFKDMLRMISDFS